MIHYDASRRIQITSVFKDILFSFINIRYKNK